MSRLPGINTELAAAVRAVNAAYNSIPPARRPAAIEWDMLDAELDAACISGDRERAMQAIEAWRTHWLAIFEAVMP